MPMTQQFAGVIRASIPTHNPKCVLVLACAHGNVPGAEYYDEDFPAIEGSRYELRIFTGKYKGEYSFIFAQHVSAIIAKIDEG